MSNSIRATAEHPVSGMMVCLACVKDRCGPGTGWEVFAAGRASGAHTYTYTPVESYVYPEKKLARARRKFYALCSKYEIPEEAAEKAMA